MTIECHYGCGKTDDLRPYGPGGVSVCFACAHATPERQTATEDAMRVVFGAASAMSPTGAVVIDGNGYHPLTDLEDLP